MSKDSTELILLKVTTLIYGAVVIYRLCAGFDHYWSNLLLPAITLFALWRPRIDCWHFLRTAFFFQFLYYSFEFFIGLILGFEVIRSLQALLILGGAATFFLTATIFVSANKHLFVAHPAQLFSRRKNAIAIVFALILPFLPWIEQNAMITFDPRILDNQAEIRGICFSPDGKKIGVINGGPSFSITIWDVETKKFISLRPSHAEPRNSLAFSPDGNYVALAYGKAHDKRRYETWATVKIDLWELASGKRIELQRTEPVELKVDSHLQIGKVAFSPDSAYLACTSGDEKIFIEIWDIAGRKLAKTFDPRSSALSSGAWAYSPDGQYIASEFAEQEIAIWDIDTRQPVQILTEGYTGFINEITYSPDGKYLAVAFNKNKNPGTSKGFIDIWDINASKVFQEFQWDNDAQVMGLSYKANGKHIASFHQMDDSVHIWDVAAGREIAKLTGPVYGEPISSIAYSSDGKYLAVANGRYIKLYNDSN